MKQPKILIYDIETSFMRVNTFTLYPERISHHNIKQDWFVICAAWKLYGKRKVEAVSINDFKRKNKEDDYGVVKALRDVIADADIIVAHNGIKFDLKKLNSRIIFHGLDPLPPVPQIDTLREYKKVASATSHRLDFLGTALTVAGKMHTDPGLWDKATDGDKKAVAQMVKYNKEDVRLLERVYKRIQPYIKTPHIGAIQGKDKSTSCPNCGSTKFESGQDKIRYTAAGVKRLQRQCNKCHKYTTFTICKQNAPYAEKAAKKKLKATRSQ
jgi:DNA polymerase III epsilon subunit-like protein